MRPIRAIWHFLKRGSAEARLGIAAGLLFVFVVGSIAFGFYAGIQFHNLQQQQIASGKTIKSELGKIKTLVVDERNSSLYLKTGVNDLTTILVYIGGSLTAICRAESLCVLPKS